MEWQKWKGKNVHLILKNNYEYNGKVTDVHDSGDGLIFFEIIDMFDEIKMFTTGEIKFIEEKRKK